MNENSPELKSNVWIHAPSGRMTPWKSIGKRQRVPRLEHFVHSNQQQSSIVVRSWPCEGERTVIIFPAGTLDTVLLDQSISMSSQGQQTFKQTSRTKHYSYLSCRMQAICSWQNVSPEFEVSMYIWLTDRHVSSIQVSKGEDRAVMPSFLDRYWGSSSGHSSPAMLRDHVSVMKTSLFNDLQSFATQRLATSWPWICVLLKAQKNHAQPTTSPSWKPIKRNSTSPISSLQFRGNSFRHRSQFTHQSVRQCRLLDSPHDVNFGHACQVHKVTPATAGCGCK